MKNLKRFDLMFVSISIDMTTTVYYIHDCKNMQTHKQQILVPLIELELFSQTRSTERDFPHQNWARWHFSFPAHIYSVGAHHLWHRLFVEIPYQQILLEAAGIDPGMEKTVPGSRFFRECCSRCINGRFQKYGKTPKSSILIGFSIINHPFWGPTPIWEMSFSCEADFIY